jgi:hypothetical protein
VMVADRAHHLRDLHVRMPIGTRAACHDRADLERVISRFTPLPMSWSSRRSRQLASRFVTEALEVLKAMCATEPDSAARRARCSRSGPDSRRRADEHPTRGFFLHLFEANAGLASGTRCPAVGNRGGRVGLRASWSLGPVREGCQRTKGGSGKRSNLVPLS